MNIPETKLNDKVISNNYSAMMQVISYIISTHGFAYNSHNSIFCDIEIEIFGEKRSFSFDGEKFVENKS